MSAKKLQVLMVDNYDSFTFNIVQYLGELGAEVSVVRNDEVTVDELQRRFDAGQIGRASCRERVFSSV